MPQITSAEFSAAMEDMNERSAEDRDGTTDYAKSLTDAIVASDAGVSTLLQISGLSGIALTPHVAVMLCSAISLGVGVGIRIAERRTEEAQLKAMAEV